MVFNMKQVPKLHLCIQQVLIIRSFVQTSDRTQLLLFHYNSLTAKTFKTKFLLAHFPYFKRI